MEAAKHEQYGPRVRRTTIWMPVDVAAKMRRLLQDEPYRPTLSRWLEEQMYRYIREREAKNGQRHDESAS